MNKENKEEKVNNKEKNTSKPRKTMRKSEKRVILIVLIITIIVITILSIIKNMQNKEERKIDNSNEQKVQSKVSVLEDGTKMNTSKKIKEKKYCDGLEFTDIEITEKDNVTIVLANVKNVTNESKKDYPIKLKIIDENSEEIISISGYIGQIKPGETIKFKTSSTFDFSNAYDIIFEK